MSTRAVPETAIRALECAEDLLANRRDALDPDSYQRALRIARTPPAAMHPAAADAMIRLYRKLLVARV
jgi:hypothetical protein